jgi:methyltransferase
VSSSQLAFLIVYALVAIHRLSEIVISRARMRARPEKALVHEPGLFPLMVLLHVLVLVLAPAEALLLDRPFVPLLAGSSAALLVGATAIRIWTLRTLGRAWNVRVLVPAASEVVIDGPYRWIRHPNYLVVIVELASLPLLHTAWLSAIGLSLFNGVVLWRRIRTEEEALARSCPRWREGMSDRARLIPGVL